MERIGSFGSSGAICEPLRSSPSRERREDWPGASRAFFTHSGADPGEFAVAARTLYARSFRLTERGAGRASRAISFAVSIKIMTLAWQTQLPSTEKLVLLALADNANDEGQCFPSVPTLVAKCGMGERTVQGVISRLRDDGHLTCHYRTGRSTVYIVHPVLTPAAAAPPQNTHPASAAPYPRSSRTPTPAAAAPTPAAAAPITITQPSCEPSLNRQSARKRASTPTATRLPADFVLSPERRTVAVAERLDAERTFAKFCDYWRAASGARARKVDWEATWRNWCRTEADRGGRTATPEPVRRWEPPEDENATV